MHLLSLHLNIHGLGSPRYGFVLHEGIELHVQLLCRLGCLLALLFPRGRLDPFLRADRPGSVGATIRRELQIGREREQTYEGRSFCVCVFTSFLLKRSSRFGFWIRLINEGALARRARGGGPESNSIDIGCPVR